MRPLLCAKALIMQTIDTHVLLTIIVPVLINAGMLVYFLGGLNARIHTLELDMEKVKGGSDRVDDRVHTMAISIAKMETNVAQISEIRSRINSLVNEVTECPFAGGPRRKKSANSGDIED